MRAVIIRVSRASITINGEPGGSMDKGFVVLVGVKPEDTTAEAANVYMAYSLPTTFFIDAQGSAVAQAVGAIDAATLQRGIDMIYTAK